MIKGDDHLVAYMCGYLLRLVIDKYKKIYIFMNNKIGLNQLSQVLILYNYLERMKKLRLSNLSR